VVLLHGHGGNAALDDIFVRRMLERDKPYLVYSLSATAGKGNQIAAMLESNEWGHAGELETSKNLAANPDLVNLKRLGKKTFPSQPAPDVSPALSPVAWVSAHPEMAVGIPQKASKEKGDKIFAIVVDGIVDVLRKIKKDRIGPAAMRAYVRKVNGVRAKVRGKD
jgi:creatinine amidohydrolase/Fe(II)-dependent formamide hydrolase-like protein